MIKPAACQQQEHLLGSRRSSHIQAEQQELFAPGKHQPHPFALGQPAKASSVTNLADAGENLS